jgi:transposase-like protein
MGTGRRIEQELSQEAQVRLARLDFSRTRGRNAALTCRHFGISRETFYGWWRRFLTHDLRSLESRSHRPRHRRQPTWTPGWAVLVLRWRLFVLPPRSPKLHGVVERAQRTHTEQS